MYTPESLKRLAPPAEGARLTRQPSRSAYEVYFSGIQPQHSKWFRWSQTVPECLALYRAIEWLWMHHKQRNDPTAVAPSVAQMDRALEEASHELDAYMLKQMVTGGHGAPPRKRLKTACQDGPEPPPPAAAASTEATAPQLPTSVRKPPTTPAAAKVQATKKAQPASGPAPPAAAQMKAAKKAKPPLPPAPAAAASVKAAKKAKPVPPRARAEGSTASAGSSDLGVGQLSHLHKSRIHGVLAA
jgi:hypothetical protein